MNPARFPMLESRSATGVTGLFGSNLYATGRPIRFRDAGLTTRQWRAAEGFRCLRLSRSLPMSSDFSMNEPP